MIYTFVYVLEASMYVYYDNDKKHTHKVCLAIFCILLILNNAVTSPSDFAPASSKEFLDIQATIECGFTLKRVRDMINTYNLSIIYSSIQLGGIETTHQINHLNLKQKTVLK